MKKLYKLIVINLFLVVLVSNITITYSKYFFSGTLSGVAVVPSSLSGILITDVTLVDSSATSNTVNSYDDRILNTSITLNKSADSFVTYEVTVTNYNHYPVSYLKREILNTSNNDIKIKMSGVNKGDTINYNESLTFTITYQYKTGLKSYNNNTINSEMEFLFGTYVDNMPKVFNLEGPCIFNGNTGNITGDACSQYADSNHIDTGVSLYSNDNYLKDYEIYFEIDHYLPSEQDAGIQQQTFVVSKLERDNYPGIVFRRSSNKLEITQKINNDKKAYSIDYNNIRIIRIVRKNNVIYYSIDGKDFEMLQDMTGFSQQFDNTVWFGAAYDSNDQPFSLLRGTLSNMYIKLGTMDDDELY